MSSLISSGGASGTGSMTILAPNTNSNQIATLPDATGTVMVSGNMPAFSAYLGTSNQSVTASTYTKVTLNQEEFDTANCFDSTTNYRFTPTVAGYYQINGAIFTTATTLVYINCAIYKNGSAYKDVQTPGQSATNGSSFVSSIVYFNGSTDYVELYARSGSGTGNVINFGSTISYLNGCLMRSA